MNKFNDYYLSEIKRYGGTKKYIQAKGKEKEALLKRVKRYASNKNIIEAGCGSASNSIYLANLGFNVDALDKDKTILKLAKKNSQLFSKQPKFINIDIVNYNPNKKYDVAFSHGVLEHYSNKDIINLINYQLKASNCVIISIPSNFFRPEQAINGDERFLSHFYWCDLIKQSNGKIVEHFSYFYDSDEIKIKLLKLLFILSFGLLPIKKPYLGFVIGAK